MSVVSSFVARIFLTTLALSVAGSALACSGRVHIEVKDSGVYGLDYAAIVAAQPGLSDCRAADLMLLHRDKQVPIRVIDNGHGGFGPGSRIQWLGLRLHGPESWFDQYSNVNVYQLAAASGAHARLRELPAPTSGAATPLRRHLHLEQENLMIRLGSNEMKPGEEPDVWQWAKLTPIDPKPFALDFDLPDLDSRARAARAAAGPDTGVHLSLDFRGMSNIAAVKKSVKPPDHMIAVTLNGKLLQTLQWDGRREMRKSLDLPQALLKVTGNTLQLHVPRRDLPGTDGNFIVDVAMFNWAEISYPIRGNLDAGSGAFSAVNATPIEMQDSTTPELFGSDGSVRLTAAIGNGRYRAASAKADVDLYPLREGDARTPTLVRAIAAADLRTADPGYDYLIVAHPRLLNAIQPLAAYHRAHGMRVTVYDVDNVYDQFSGGIAHPSAIRDLVAWGTAHWKTKPRYLLLVGDASADIHHDVRQSHNRSTDYALRPDPLRDELLMQGGLSSMPTTSYPKWDPDLPNRNLIPTWQFASYEGQGATDNGFVAIKPGDFHPQLAVGRLPVVDPAEVTAIVDKTLQYLSKPALGSWRRDVTFISTDEVASFKQESDRIATALGKQGFAVTSLYTKQDAKDAVAVHAELKRDLDAGSLLVHFLGHGGAFIWRVGPPADLFTLKDVSELTNAGRYPMVLAMTCFSAPFDNPTEDSIGERFLREADKGAVAVLGASWMNWPDPKNSRDLIRNLLKPGMAVGDAVLAVKRKSNDRPFVEMYNLLGDPAVVLARPKAELRFMRTNDRFNPQVVVRIPNAADFGGNVDVDWVDAHGKMLLSRRYQSRDIQFFLPIAQGATEIRVLTTDTRDGSTAFGALNLLAPAPAQKKEKVVLVAPKSVVVPKAPRLRAPVDPHDRISVMDFDAPAAPAPPTQ